MLPIAIRSSRWAVAAPATVSAATSSKTIAAASACRRYRLAIHPGGGALWNL